MKNLIQGEEIPSNTTELKVAESRLDPGLLASVLSSLLAQTPAAFPYAQVIQGFPNLKRLASPRWLTFPIDG